MLVFALMHAYIQNYQSGTILEGKVVVFTDQEQVSLFHFPTWTTLRKSFWCEGKFCDMQSIIIIREKEFE